MGKMNVLMTYVSTHGYPSDAEEQTYEDTEDFTTMSLQKGVRKQVYDRRYEALDAHELMTKIKRNNKYRLRQCEEENKSTIRNKNIVYKRHLKQSFLFV